MYISVSPCAANFLSFRNDNEKNRSTQRWFPPKYIWKLVLGCILNFVSVRSS